MTLQATNNTHENNLTDNITASAVPLFDIGANLCHASFSRDLDRVILSAKDKGVEGILVTGTDLAQSRRAAELAQNYPGTLYSTAGIHPHDASQFQPDSRQQLEQLVELPQVKAIGECGLDFNRMYSSKRQQISAFEQQIQLAIDLQMPLFLHERDAYNVQRDMLAYYRDQFTGGVIHCFTGEKQQAFGYLDLDLYIGITGWICDERRGYHLHEFIADIPLQRLLIETDAPYLLPRVKPKLKLKSSRRNEPCTLPCVLAEIAAHSHHELQAIARATTDNAKKLFAI